MTPPDPRDTDERWDAMEDERGTVMVHAEVPSDDVVRSFYEVPDMLAMMLWRDKRTTFAEALTDLFAERKMLRDRLAHVLTTGEWECIDCGAKDGRYDNGYACADCVSRSFGEAS